jgi:putative ABC transport system substrate-binding protein
MSPRRREVLIFVGGITAWWPRTVHALQTGMPVIGFLGSGSPVAYGPFVAAFRQGLSDSGFIEGKNVTIEFRWAGGRFDRLPALAADLVEREVDVIVTSGGTPSARAAKDATAKIPIVFSGVTDPIGADLVATLAQPGGNLTGLSDISSQLTPKRLELLVELVPQAKVIGLLVNPNSAVSAPMIRDVQAAVPEGIKLEILNASSDSEIDTAFSLIPELGVGAVVVASDPFYSSRRDQLVALSLSYSVPAIYSLREFVLAGGLINYGASVTGTYRQQGIYTAKILNGAKPADLPVLQATAFDLAINLKTASALGITVPQSLLARAELIE